MHPNVCLTHEDVLPIYDERSVKLPIVADGSALQAPTGRGYQGSARNVPSPLHRSDAVSRRERNGRAVVRRR